MSTLGPEIEAAVDERGPAPAVDDTIESTAGKLVYLYLAVNDGATVTELKRSLDMPTLELYPILRRLREHEVVERTADRFVVDT